MKNIKLKFSTAMATIVYGLVIAGLALFPVVAAAERSLEITDLRLIPATIPVNQPFEFEIAFKANDSGSSGGNMAAVLYFKILKNNKTLFTSTSYPINARNGEVKAWLTRMNPVSAKGIYTISAHLSYDQLTAQKSIELAIGMPQKAVNKTIRTQPESITLSGQSPPNNDEKDIIHVRHILLKNQADAYRVLSGMSGLSGNNLRDKFISEAKSSSVGPTGKNGGDLGMIKRGLMVIEFENAAFSLSPGSITTSPVKTVYGYHIIYRQK